MIYEDLRPKKQAVIEYIEATWSGELSYLNPAKDRFCPQKLAELDRLCLELKVDHDKLSALLKSQIMSGNVKGAVRVVIGTQDRKFNNWGKLLSLPLTFPIYIGCLVLAAPVILYRWIVRNV